MVKALNNLWIDGTRCWAKVARFSKKERLGVQPKRLPFFFGNGGVHGRGDNVYDKVQDGANTAVNPMPSNRAGKRLFSEVVSGQTGVPENEPQESLVTLEERVIPESSEWTGRLVLGEAKNFLRLCNMKECLAKVGIEKMELRFWGGMKVLITFSTSEEAIKFLESEEKVWKEWLSSATLWNGEWVDYERLAWLKIFGIPAALWDCRHVIKIGERFGKVVKGVKNMFREGNLAYVHVGVILRSGKRLNEEVTVEWGEHRFTCWVSEDAGNWVPGFVEDSVTIVHGTRHEEPEVEEWRSEKQGVVSPAEIPARDQDLENEQSQVNKQAAEVTAGVFEVRGDVHGEPTKAAHVEGEEGVGSQDNNEAEGDNALNYLKDGPVQKEFLKDKVWATTFHLGGLGPKKRKRPGRMGRGFYAEARRKQKKRSFDLNNRASEGDSPSSGSAGVKKKRRRLRQRIKRSVNIEAVVVPDLFDNKSGGLEDGFELE
ncbi:hypothetical protein Hdeb2414_s0017g00512601 [Helianthus debilis subsp. tardiflorus]